MLAKGEVEEIIVRPDVEVVTIILHDGAVVKSKKVIILKFNSVQMQILFSFFKLTKLKDGMKKQRTLKI